jgi:hypothetical protein
LTHPTNAHSCREAGVYTITGNRPSPES